MSILRNMKTLRCPHCNAEVKNERIGDYWSDKPSRNDQETRTFFCGYEITYSGGTERPLSGSKCVNSKEEKAKAKAERATAEEIVAFIESKVFNNLDPKADAVSAGYLKRLSAAVKDASKRYSYQEINPSSNED